MAGKQARVNVERDARIIKLWNERPDLSTSQVATKVGHGCTRDTVAGALFRARKRGEKVRTIEKKAKPAKRTSRAKRPSKERERTGSPLPPNPDVASIAATSPYIMGLVIRDVEFEQCRYVVADGDEFAFCSERKRDGSSYCEAHHSLCYRKIDGRRRAGSPDRKGKQRMNRYG